MSKNHIDIKHCKDLERCKQKCCELICCEPICCESNCIDIVQSCFTTCDCLELSFQYCKKLHKKKCGCYSKDIRPSVILLHGIGTNSDFWHCLFDKLCPVANVYALDFPNTGKSSATCPSNLTLEYLTKIVNQFINHLCLEKVYLVGHGIGGDIALNFSVTYPDRVIRIAVSSTSPKYSPSSDWKHAINHQIGELLERAIETSDPIILHEIASTYIGFIDPNNCEDKCILIKQLINNISQYQDYSELIRNIDIRNILDKITIPVLIMSGTKDPIVPFGASLFMREKICRSALVEFYKYGNNFPILNTNLYNKNVFNFFFVKCDPCRSFLKEICGQNKKCECSCDCGCGNSKPCNCNDKCKCKCKKICELDSDNDTDCNKNKCKIIIPCRYT